MIERNQLTLRPIRDPGPFPETFPNDPDDDRRTLTFMGDERPVLEDNKVTTAVLADGTDIELIGGLPCGADCRCAGGYYWTEPS